VGHCAVTTKHAAETNLQTNLSDGFLLSAYRKARGAFGQSKSTFSRRIGPADGNPDCAAAAN
jgi:hypothetical protein